MTTYSVDSESILNSSGRMTTSASVIRGEIGQVTSIVSALTGSWGGNASGAFQSLMTDWNSAARQMDESLTSITLVLASTGQSYEEVEMANMQRFAR